VPTINQLFDPEDVYRDTVAGRSLVYLDTSVWVTLADGRSEKARACLTLCERAVRDGRMLFPTSHASISELFEHPEAAPRLRQAGVMDALSLGVA
jgi:hypothetical protein